MLPVFFLSLPAGVFADTLNRKRLLSGTTIFMAVLAGALARTRAGAGGSTEGPANRQAFVAAMADVGRSRRRSGAQRWRLWRDGEHPNEFHEVFTVRSWSEHLRQHHDRLTGTDQHLLRAAKDLARSEPIVRHLFPAREGVEENTNGSATAVSEAPDTPFLG